MDVSSPTSQINYTLSEKFGINVDPTVGGVNVGTFLTSIAIGNDPLGTGRLDGSFCFSVKAVSNEGNGVFVNLGASGTVCHAFLHTVGGGNRSGIAKADANGLQVGFGDLWKFAYAMDDNALLTMQIYPPGETFTTGANGLVTPNLNLPVTKTIYSGAALAGEGLSAPFSANTDGFWDGTNEAGALQSNGLYFLFVSVNDPLLAPALTYASVATLPLDYRFTALTTSGISSSVGTANINYTITANSSVRTVIAMPGRQFTIDSSSNVQAVNGGVIDTSTNSVVAVIQGQVNFGANIATWNGINTLGVAVATGVYAIGMSAMDGAGNPALNLAGANGPLTGTISVDRIPAQGAASGTAPSVTGISIGGTALNLAGGTQVTSFGTINIALSATGGANTTVALSGPLGPIVGGLVNVGGTAVTFSTGVVISTVGAYAVTINPVDPTGNFPGPQQVTNFVVVTTPGPSVSSVTLSGTLLALSGGSSVGNGAPFSPTISVTLSAAAGTNTTVTLNGPAGPILGGVITGLPGATITYSTTAVAFSTPGAYSLVIHPIDATNTNIGPTQNVGFNVTAGAGAGGPGTGSNASFSSTAVAFPNPVKKSPATISFQLGLASTVTIDIYTMTGQRVLHQVASYPASAAAQTFLWQLANDAGNSVANGVYLVHVSASSAAGTNTFKKKILVVR